MTQHEIPATRIAVATATSWPGRSYVVEPAHWRAAARTLAGHGTAEVRASPGMLEGLNTAALLDAARLRDAGIGLALAGAGGLDQLRWLRVLPWSTVIVHRRLLPDDPRNAGHHRRVLDRWVEAACRRGLACVAPVRSRAAVSVLALAGFTHGEVWRDEFAGG